MDKKTVIAFVLIGAIFMVWLYLNTPDQSKMPKKAAKKDTTLVKDSVMAAKKTDSSAVKKQEEEKKLSEKPAGDSLDYGKAFTAPVKPEETILVETDMAIFEFSTKGGNIRKAYLKKFKTFYADQSDNFRHNLVQLLTPGGAFDLSFVSVEGKKVDTKNLDFAADVKDGKLSVTGTNKASLTFTVALPDNKSIVKKFSFEGDKYNIEAEVFLNGLSNMISGNTYDVVWGASTRFVEVNTVDEANTSHASVYSGGEHTIVDATDLTKPAEKSFDGNIDWISIRNKYFSAIISPDKPTDVTGAYINGSRKALDNKGIMETYSAEFRVPFGNSNSEKKSFSIYLGPVEYGLLKSYNKNYQVIIDFGNFFGLKFIVRPIAEYLLLPLFTFLYSIIHNYGVAIIIFSLIVKLLLYPFTKKSFESMKKMQLLQPMITEIKEKYKDDPQRVNKETMKLYSTYGINPAGGCLPLLFQMPVFVALWGIFQAAIGFRLQPFVWWIKDLSRPDVIATLPFSIPLFNVHEISGLALLMGITTFVQQKMTVKDPSQKAMVYFMPIFLTIMFMSFPSGLNLYYFMFNIFSIVQQEFVNRKHSDLKLVPVKEGKKKQGFMQRLMDAAEQNAKAKQQMTKKRK